MTSAELEALLAWSVKRGSLKVGDDVFEMKCVELANPPEDAPRVAVASFCTSDDADAFAKIGHVLTALAEARAENERLKHPSPEAIREGVMTLTMPWADVIPPDANPDEYVMRMVWGAIARAALEGRGR